MLRLVLAMVLAGVLAHLPCPAQWNLLLVSNRLPWTVAAVDGVGSLKPSAGGLATALARTTSGPGRSGWDGPGTSPP